MKFPEIFEGLKEGKKYRRASWEYAEYIRIEPNSKMFNEWVLIHKAPGKSYEFYDYEYFHVEPRDWFADDWEEVE